MKYKHLLEGCKYCNDQVCLWCHNNNRRGVSTWWLEKWFLMMVIQVSSNIILFYHQWLGHKRVIWCNGGHILTEIETMDLLHYVSSTWVGERTFQSPLVLMHLSRNKIESKYPWITVLPVWLILKYSCRNWHRFKQPSWPKTLNYVFLPSTLKVNFNPRRPDSQFGLIFKTIQNLSSCQIPTLNICA